MHKKSSSKNQDRIVDLDEDITHEEFESSQKLFELLAGKKVSETRILFKKRKELFIQFEDGTRLFVDNFNDDHDISVTIPDM